MLNHESINGLELSKYVLTSTQFAGCVPSIPVQTLDSLIKSTGENKDFTSIFIGQHPNLGWFSYSLDSQDGHKKILYIEKGRKL
jgi:hypothetical protein